MNDFLLNFMRSGDLDLLTFQSCGVSGYTFHCKLCNITVNQTAIRNYHQQCVRGRVAYFSGDHGHHPNEI